MQTMFGGGRMAARIRASVLWLTTLAGVGRIRTAAEQQFYVNGLKVTPACCLTIRVFSA